MKVLLINPNSKSQSKYAGVETQPLGLAYIAAVLENNGYDVDIIDAFTLGLGDEEVKKLVRGKQPDLVGITALTPTIRAAYRTANLVREVSDAFICIGGPHVSFLPEQSLKECESLDAVVIGEGEYTMLDLVKNFGNNENLENVRGIFFKKGTRIIRNPPREPIENLDVLPFPARHLLPAERYGFLTIISSRGCPFSCVYCASSAFMGRRVRMRGVENVVEEIEQIVAQYPKKEIAFMDDIFTLNKQRVEKFCEELKKRGIDIIWGCSSRVDTITKSLLSKMKASGCKMIYYGVESASQELLDNFYHKRIKLEQVRKAVEWTKEAGIKCMCSFILGAPQESREDMRLTIKFARELDPDLAQFSILTPFPGTKLFNYASEKDLLLTYDWSEYTGSNPIIKNDRLTTDEVKKMLKWAYLKFYTRPKFFGEFLRTISRITKLKLYSFTEA